MSTERITSDRNLREQFNAIATQLKGIEQLIADLRAARERVNTFASQSEANVVRFADELEKAEHARRQLDEAVAEERRAIEAVSDERLRLTAQLNVAEAASGRFAKETSEIGSALSRQLQEQLDALRAQIATAAQEEHLALDARQKEYVAATRTQLDDVLRAYQLANARQQEVERALGDRVTAIEGRVSDVAQRSSAALEQERKARAQHEEAASEELARNRRLVVIALALAAIGVAGAVVAFYLAIRQ